jgi:membrane fusion protein
LPLFRPEALEDSEFGEAFAFGVPQWRTLGLAAAVAALLFFIFGSFASFDRVVTVRGIVAPASGVSRLSAPHPGIVTAVLVRQGRLVTAGEPLLRIASADLLPDGAAAPTQILQTYRDQQDNARARQAAEDERRQAERQRLSQQVAEHSAALESLQLQKALQEERIGNNERRLRSLAALRARGYVSELTYQQQQETVLALRQQLAVLDQRSTESLHQSRAARLQMTELEAEARRARLDSDSSLLALERGAAGAQVQAQVTIAAPASGQVASLRASPGMAVARGDELVTLVPKDAGLEALLFVPPSAAGSLRTGQPVALRYDAFPYQRHGVGRGVVTQIATAASMERYSAMPVYRVKVRLVDGDRFELRPDTTLVAVVTLERRTLLDWLLAPLREQWRSRRLGTA